MQYSMRTMILVMTAAGVLCFALFAKPEYLGVTLLSAVMLFFMPAAMISCLIYGEGHLRAFAIGALVPLTVTILASLVGQTSLYFLSLVTEEDPGLYIFAKVFCAVVLASSLISGLILLYSPTVLGAAW